MKNQLYQQPKGKGGFRNFNPVSLFIAFLVMVIILLYVNHFKMSGGQDQEMETDRVRIELPVEEDES